MEPAGFALSIAGILSTFQVCLRSYGDILSLKNRDEEVQAGYLAMSIELYKMRRHHQEMMQDSSSVSQEAKDLRQLLLNRMDADLEKLSDVLRRHASATETGQAKVTDITDTNPGGKTVVQKAKRLAHGSTWIAHDKTRHKELIEGIKQWNAGLAELLPEVKRHRISNETISESIARDSPLELEYIKQSTERQYPIISRSAAVRSMSLRCRGQSSGQTFLDKPRWKISIDCFEWQSRRTKGRTDETTVRTYDVPLDISKASLSERAFATLHVHDNAASFASDSAATSVMVEWRDDFRSEESLRQFEHRLDYLVLTLRKMAGGGRHEDRSTNNRTYGELSLLPCLGWITSSSQFERIGLVFDLTQRQSASSLPPSIPITATASPPVVSLHQLITRDRDSKISNPNPPALGNRFGLAYALALNLGNLSTVGWVHKEFRSHNVLFACDEVEKSACNRHELARPFLAGFTYARPSSTNTQDLSVLNPDPAYALYRPPWQVIYKHQQQQMTYQASRAAESGAIETGYVYYNRDDNDSDEDRVEGVSTSATSAPLKWTAAMDIYGLGMVLLEIGMWRTVQSLRGKKSVSKSEFLEKSLPGLVESLSYRMGNLYMDVVRRCLDLGDWVDDEGKLREFWADMLENLALCRA